MRDQKIELREIDSEINTGEHQQEQQQKPEHTKSWPILKSDLSNNVTSKSYDSVRTGIPTSSAGHDECPIKKGSYKRENSVS